MIVKFLTQFRKTKQTNLRFHILNIYHIHACAWGPLIILMGWGSGAVRAPHATTAFPFLGDDGGKYTWRKIICHEPPHILWFNFFVVMPICFLMYYCRFNSIQLWNAMRNLNFDSYYATISVLTVVGGRRLDHVEHRELVWPKRSSLLGKLGFSNVGQNDVYYFCFVLAHPDARFKIYLSFGLTWKQYIQQFHRQQE